MKAIPVITILAWPIFGAGAVAAWNAELWPLTVLLVLAASICANSTILTMHEAVHMLLSPNQRLNNLGGIISGTVTLTPMNLFRVVHNSHHGMIGTEQDLEFWPYVNTHSKRWHRVLAAFTELTIAPLYYFVMFTRAIFIGNMSPRIWRRCWRDVAIMVVPLAMTLYLVATNGWWTEFVIAYLIPMLLASNMQSWRRLTEHVGLYGDNELSLTRTIIPTNPIEKFYCLVMLNENYHAPHHKKASIKWTDLPEATMVIHDSRPDLRPLFFPSYLKAIPCMLKELHDPRIGKQWLVWSSSIAEQLSPLDAPDGRSNGRMRN
jgi:fatty acid desaturase